MVGMAERNAPGINVTVQGRDSGIDYEKLGEATARALAKSNIGFKCDERVFARLIEDVKDYV